jgi:hypothetical protein
VSVFITDADALQKMGQIEGKDWLAAQAQARHEGHPNDFHSYLIEYQKYQGPPTEETLRVAGHCSIYGAGGWNRYFVRKNGKIIYSAYHGPSKVKQAEDIGFDISR